MSSESTVTEEKAAMRIWLHLVQWIDLRWLNTRNPPVTPEGARVRCSTQQYGQKRNHSAFLRIIPQGILVGWVFIIIHGIDPKDSGRKGFILSRSWLVTTSLSTGWESGCRWRFVCDMRYWDKQCQRLHIYMRQQALASSSRLVDYDLSIRLSKILSRISSSTLWKERLNNPENEARLLRVNLLSKYAHDTTQPVIFSSRAIIFTNPSWCRTTS